MNLESLTIMSAKLYSCLSTKEEV